MKQKIVSLVEVFLELEDLVTIPDSTDTDKKDLECALRDFTRLFGSLVLEVTNFDFQKVDGKIEDLNKKIRELNKKIEELKNEKK